MDSSRNCRVSVEQLSESERARAAQLLVGGDSDVVEYARSFSRFRIACSSLDECLAYVACLSNVAAAREDVNGGDGGAGPALVFAHPEHGHLAHFPTLFAHDEVYKALMTHIEHQWKIAKRQSSVDWSSEARRRLPITGRWRLVAAAAAAADGAAALAAPVAPPALAEFIEREYGIPLHSIFSSPSIDQMCASERDALRLTRRFVNGGGGARFERLAAAAARFAATATVHFDARCFDAARLRDIHLEYALSPNCILGESRGERVLCFTGGRRHGRKFSVLRARSAAAPAAAAAATLDAVFDAAASAWDVHDIEYEPLPLEEVNRRDATEMMIVPPLPWIDDCCTLDALVSVDWAHPGTLEPRGGGKFGSIGGFSFTEPIRHDATRHGADLFVTPDGHRTPLCVAVRGAADADAAADFVRRTVLVDLTGVFVGVPAANDTTPASVMRIGDDDDDEFVVCTPMVVYCADVERTVRECVKTAPAGCADVTRASLMTRIPLAVWSGDVDVAPIAVWPNCPYAASIVRHFDPVSTWRFDEIRSALLEFTAVVDVMPPAIVGRNCLAWPGHLVVRRVTPVTYVATIVGGGRGAVYVALKWDSSGELHTTTFAHTAVPVLPPFATSPTSLASVGSHGIIDARNSSHLRQIPISSPRVDLMISRTVSDMYAALAPVGHVPLELTVRYTNHDGRFPAGVFQPLPHHDDDSELLQLSITCLKGATGCGKTYTMTRYLLTGAADDGVIWVCPRVALVEGILSSLRETLGNGWVVIDGRNESLPPGCSRRFVVATTIHSLHKFRSERPDLLRRLTFVVDEACLMNEDLSTKIVDVSRTEPALNALLAGGRVSHCVLMDAALDPLVVAAFASRIAHAHATPSFASNLALSRRRVRIDVNFHESDFHVSEGRPVRFAEVAALLGEICDSISQTRWAVFFSSKSELMAFKMRAEKLLDDGILAFTSDHRHNPAHLVDMLTNARLFLYTTAAGAGVDVSFPHGARHFEKVAVIGIEAPYLHPMAINQAIGRVRNTGEIVIGIRRRCADTYFVSPMRMLSARNGLYRRLYGTSLGAVCESVTLEAKKRSARHVVADIDREMEAQWVVGQQAQARVAPVSYAAAMRYLRYLPFARLNFLCGILLDSGCVVSSSLFTPSEMDSRDDLDRSKLAYDAAEFAVPTDTLKAEFTAKCEAAGLSGAWADRIYTPALRTLIASLSSLYTDERAAKFVHAYAWLMRTAKPSGLDEWRETLRRLVCFFRPPELTANDTARVLNQSQGYIDDDDYTTREFTLQQTHEALAAVALYQAALHGGLDTPWPSEVTTREGEQIQREGAFMNVSEFLSGAALSVSDERDTLALVADVKSVLDTFPRNARARVQVRNPSMTRCMTFAFKSLMADVRRASARRPGGTTTHFAPNEMNALRAIDIDYAITSHHAALAPPTDDDRRFLANYFDSVERECRETRLTLLQRDADHVGAELPTELQRMKRRRKSVTNLAAAREVYQE